MIKGDIVKFKKTDRRPYKKAFCWGITHYLNSGCVYTYEPDYLKNDVGQITHINGEWICVRVYRNNRYVAVKASEIVYADYVLRRV